MACSNCTRLERALAKTERLWRHERTMRKVAEAAKDQLAEIVRKRDRMPETHTMEATS